jgi:hypothetical protein
MDLWPSKRQWKSWNLPSKYAIIGVVIGIISLGLYLFDKACQSGNSYLSQSDLADSAEFNCTLIFHKADMRPLEDHLRGNSRSRLGGRQFDGILSQFVSNQFRERDNLYKAESNNYPQKIIDFYHNMILIELIDHFFWMYSAGWDASVYSIREGTVEIRTSSANPNGKPPDCDCLTWGHFLNTEEQDDFYDLLSSFSNFTNSKEMRVPPGTRVRFIITEYRKAIVLTNPYVEVTIAINKTSASSGLGDYKWLLSNELEGDEFWAAHFGVACSARFEGSKAADPDIARYRQWVEVLFSEIRYLLDEQERLKRAREYHDSTSPS